MKFKISFIIALFVLLFSNTFWFVRQHNLNQENHKKELLQSFEQNFESIPLFISYFHVGVFCENSTQTKLYTAIQSMAFSLDEYKKLAGESEEYLELKKRYEKLKPFLHKTMDILERAAKNEVMELLEEDWSVLEEEITPQLNMMIESHSIP